MPNHFRNAFCEKQPKSFVGAFPFRWLVYNQKVEICKRQFLHKSVNLSFTLVIMKDKLRDLGVNRLLQNNTLCEIRSPCRRMGR